MRNSAPLVLLVCAPLLLMGCGQKGPLYLPKDDNPQPAAQPVPETPAEPTVSE